MLEGDINQINLVERLVELWREQFTGAIRFENDGIIKIIYFKGGDVLSASTNDRDDAVDEILMRANKVSREHVKQALARRKESETLGDAMLNLGYITRKELTWARRVQVVGVIRSIAEWMTGSFTIVADYLPKRDEGTLFPLPQVLVELIVTDQDKQKFERLLAGGSLVLARTPDFDEVYRRLGLNEDAEAIVAQLDGERTASEIAAASGRDAFNVYKLLHAFVTLGILEHKPQASHQLSMADDFAAAGVADAADSWDETPLAQPSPTLDLGSAPDVSADYEGLAASPSLPDVSAWGEEEPYSLVHEAPLGSSAPAPLPQWDAPFRSAPAPIAGPTPQPQPEDQWGFDEAQLETARRASNSPVPPPGKPKEGRGRFVLLLVLMGVAILAGAAYGGYLWWQSREAGAEADTGPQVATTTSTAASSSAPADPGTITELPASQTTTAVREPASATAATTTAPAGSVPATTTLAPPATTPGAAAPSMGALPAVRPRVSTATPAAAGTAGPVDAMARQFAANPEGNFTVQIQILCHPGNVERLMRSGGANIWFVPQSLGERACYRVFWGHYETRAEAQQALATVPASVRDANAAVKPVPR